MALSLASGGVGVLSAMPAHAATSDAFSYLSRLNSERAAHGLPKLTMRSDLTAIAQRWSGRLASAHQLSHNPSLVSQVANWQAVGENVGSGPTIAALDSAFMASPKHRDNVLDRTYNDVGIGTVRSGGVIWITVDFRDPMYAESSSTIVRRTSTASHPVAKSTRHRTLRVGSRGSDVRAVQRKVHATADGIFGPRTRRAVIAFQRHHHLRANGIVNAPTWKALHL
jgi:peptidoglycan hydrolase-like protein with peptidoglycan-binding domain